MSRSSRAFFLLSLVGPLSGCGGSGGGTCDPGATRECSCPGGQEGRQTCSDAGDKWGTCEGCDSCSCAQKECGPDGCGGDCGKCPAGSECLEGACVPCSPDCHDKACGDDNCGGTCGTCQPGWTCSPTGTCDSTCVPDCHGRDCGTDGCGASCGECKAGESCSDQGTCMCKPDCVGRQCGPDGCGSSCGKCPEDYYSCVSGECILDKPDLRIVDSSCSGCGWYHAYGEKWSVKSVSTMFENLGATIPGNTCFKVRVVLSKTHVLYGSCPDGYLKTNLSSGFCGPLEYGSSSRQTAEWLDVTAGILDDGSPIPKGEFTIYVMLDADKQVAEYNEQNNCDEIGSASIW